MRYCDLCGEIITNNQTPTINVEYDNAKYIIIDCCSLCKHEFKLFYVYRQNLNDIKAGIIKAIKNKFIENKANKAKRLDEVRDE